MPLVREDSVATPDRRDEPLASTCPASRSTSTSRRSRPPSDAADGHRPAVVDVERGDPLLRKLELAEEFQRIGDKDGARDLLREVLATATGATKPRRRGCSTASADGSPAPLR